MDAAWIRGFLDDLVRAKLVIAEGNKVLALALPAAPDGGFV